LKQVTLAFPSSKRSPSKFNPKAKNEVVHRTTSAPSTSSQVAEIVDSSGSERSHEDEERISSNDERIQAPAPKKTAASKTPASKLVDKGKASLEYPTVGAINLRAENAGKWRKHYGVVRTKMGNLAPIHSEEQNKVHQILRVFDTSYEYGPCVGVTRLERWERARALGLNPPVEVHEILSTKQGLEEDEFKQSVFYGMV
jgi:DNA polymerase delta subunit 4